MTTTTPIHSARPLSGSECLPQLAIDSRYLPLESDVEHLQTLNLDGYRVALLAPPLLDAQRNARPSSEAMVVLEVTWKQFLGHLQEEFGRPQPQRGNTFMQFGDIQVNLESMEVRRSNRVVTLTALEFKLLAFLVQNPRKAFSRADLLDQVWGYDCYPCTRTVDTHILRLRQKLEADAACPSHFVTVYGTGYKFHP